MAASAPRFSKPPAILPSADDPSCIYLECQVQAVPQPDVNWFHNNTPLSSSSTRQKQILESKNNNIYDLRLEISDASPTDSGTYRVVIKNAAGEVAANLSLNLGVEESDSADAG